MSGLLSFRFSRFSVMEKSIDEAASGGCLVLAFFVEDKDVAGLTIECFADGLERREANRPRLPSLEDRQVRERDIDRLRELGE